MRHLLYQLLFGFLNLISRLPFWVLHRVSDGLFLLIYYVIGYRKKMVLKNMRRSFPEKAEHELKQMRRAFYRHFTDLIIESVKSATMSQKEFQQRYYVVNQHLFDAYYNKGESVIVLSPHTGNWEWVFSLVYLLSFNTFAVYQRLSNRYMDAYIRKTRQRFGAQMIPTTEVFATITGAAQQSEPMLTWMAADQACKPAKAHWVNFLNQDTTFHKGFEDLARQTNQTVLFLDIKKVKRSYYELELHVITEDPNALAEGQIVEAFARLTEKRIKADPPNWLWTHNRWKHRR